MSTTMMASTPTFSGGMRAVDWGLRILIAIAFLGAASAKLAGVPAMVELFDHVGLGQGFRYITAAV